ASALMSGSSRDVRNRGQWQYPCRARVSACLGRKRFTIRELVGASGVVRSHRVAPGMPSGWRNASMTEIGSRHLAEELARLSTPASKAPVGEAILLRH